MLDDGISVPTSYKSTSIKPVDKTWGFGFYSWIYKFKNQQGKTLKLERIFGTYTEVTDNSNQKFKAELSTRPIAMMYCTSNALHIRSVSELKLKGIKNEYGESIQLPLMLWLVDAEIKTKQPSSNKLYDFQKTSASQGHGDSIDNTYPSCVEYSKQLCLRVLH